MSHKQVLKTAIKFAQKQNEQFKAQREKLEKFSDAFMKKFRTIITEMEGELFVLKQKNFNIDQWKKMSQLWRQLIEIYKKFDDDHPYNGAKELVNFISDRSISDMIAKLNNNIQKHLKENKIEFGKSSMLKQVKINSLRNIVIFASNTESYMNKNILLPDPRDVITLPPPRKDLVIDDPLFTPVGPDMQTLPGIKNIK